jgi:hypothetical protein
MVNKMNIGRRRRHGEEWETGGLERFGESSHVAADGADPDNRNLHFPKFPLLNLCPQFALPRSALHAFDARPGVARQCGPSKLKTMNAMATVPKALSRKGWNMQRDHTFTGFGGSTDPGTAGSAADVARCHYVDRRITSGGEPRAG